ncbi:LytTR family DNA-binding domain-containing protein [Halosquirtibacter laminarini]|uniref:LytTR family DNA-binding domain-containing protein n=1 Tax=Halosquirtibacter laminarini TaxID=3374600 RepID=A0AC61NMQ2_9BACT|nr:LytTR family DNA-binding domain-containing protein [Prolixibacteraceae bacterium]
MKVLIIEDEELLAEELERNLMEIGSSTIHICDKLETVKESVEWLQVNTCDLIFMDVHLSDGECFDIFKQVNTSIPIVFLTAYDQYLHNAFHVNSIGYILKPYEIRSIVKVLEKYENISEFYEPSSPRLEENNGIIKGYLTRLMLRLGRVYKPVDIEDVSYFMSEDKHLFAIMNNGRRFYYDSTLRELENEVDPSKFFRVNRSYMVNKNCVSELVLYSKNRYRINLELDVEEIVLLSTSKVPQFKEWLLL